MIKVFVLNRTCPRAMDWRVAVSLGEFQVSYSSNTGAGGLDCPGGSAERATGPPVAPLAVSLPACLSRIWALKIPVSKLTI